MVLVTLPREAAEQRNLEGKAVFKGKKCTKVN